MTCWSILLGEQWGAVESRKAALTGHKTEATSSHRTLLWYSQAWINLNHTSAFHWQPGEFSFDESDLAFENISSLAIILFTCLNEH